MDHVGIKVIVDHGGIFVRPSHLIAAEAATAARVEVTKVHPDTCGFKQQFRATRLPDTLVTSSFNVLHRRISDGGIDVILRRAGRKITRTLFPADGAPREQRAFLVRHLPRALPCFVKDAAPVFQE